MENDDIIPPLLPPDAGRHLGDLVRRLEQYQGPWAKMRGGERLNEQTVIMPWWEAAPIVDEALTFLYDQRLVVRFAWSAWDEGRSLLRKSNLEQLTSLDRATVLKLLTAVARNERFNDGAWVSLFEAGQGTILFRRLHELEIAAGTNGDGLSVRMWRAPAR